MAEHKIISASTLMKGGIFDTVLKKERHHYKATRNGRAVDVTDRQGQPVKVTFAGTESQRSTYAYIQGVGYIGGWQYPHKAQPFHMLVAYINMGVLYSDSSLLPTYSTMYYITHPDDPAQYGPYKKHEAEAIRIALSQATGKDYTATMFNAEEE